MNILVETADGSRTLFNTQIGEHYHSSHGALQESQHVFISAGLKFAMERDKSKTINILEVGFGTGLNFILSYAYAEEKQVKLNYAGIEAFPLPENTIKETCYEQYVPSPVWQAFTANYEQALKQRIKLSSFTELEIITQSLADFNTATTFDVVYYDAFSVRHQAEMWTDAIIAHTCGFLKSGGIFVTYAITGKLKRALKSCGFSIEKLPGAPGKREMLRAIKH